MLKTELRALHMLGSVTKLHPNLIHRLYFSCKRFVWGGGDGTVRTGACCASMRTGVQIPSSCVNKARICRMQL